MTSRGTGKGSRGRIGARRVVRGGGVRAAAWLIVVAVLSGCSVTVGGAAQRQPIGDRAALQALLPTAEEVGTAVGNRLDPAGPPVVGSIDVLPYGIRDSSDAAPLDCLGAVTPLMRVVYEGSGVMGAAWRNYARLGEGLTASSAQAGVLRYDTDAEAARVFSRFVTQWRSCEGTTVTLFLDPISRTGLELTVTDVRVDGAVLSATILHAADDGGPGFRTEHAVGVGGEYLADVDVAITDPDSPYQEMTARAVDVVSIVLAKISAAR